MNQQRGMSLIELIVAIGIMSIVMLAVATMQSNQVKETRAVGEVLAVNDLQKLLTASMSDGSVCFYLTNDPNPITFNASAVSPASPVIITPAHQSLYASVNPGPPPVPGAIVAQVGLAPSAYSKTVVVNSITLQITDGPAALVAAPNQSFKGNWTVGFDNTQTVRPLKPVSVSTTLTVDATNPGAAKISGCQNSATGNQFTVFKQTSIPAGTISSNNGSFANIDFSKFIPAADRANVVAIQVTIHNFASEVSTGGIGPEVDITMDGTVVFSFEFDTRTDAERWMSSNTLMVTPGNHVFKMSSVFANITPFSFTITGYMALANQIPPTNQNPVFVPPPPVKPPFWRPPGKGVLPP